MITNLHQLGTQAIESSTGSKKMKLSENAQSMVFQLFTKNVYSNPIGTIVREITSNCFDSHVEAGVNAPVIIKKSFDSETNMHYISFIDFGVGMSPDRVENIYGVYFESTKRLNNEQIGGFGIGGKTPLAYKRPTGIGEGEYDNSFYVITIHNSKKYYYCIFEGAESPEISLLHEETTTEKNGTEIRIPVLSKDIDTFQKEMVRQLYYFENIIFEGFDEERSTNEKILNNQYQIFKANNFLYRGDQYSRSIHVCLGRVAYPIDFAALGLYEYDFRIPVALNFNVGELNVTVSRESLDYNENNIKKIKDKLELVKAELESLLMKQYENIVTLKDYYEKYYDNKDYLVMPNNEKFNVSDLIDTSNFKLPNFKYNELNKFPNEKSLFNLLFDYKEYGNIVRSRWSRSNNQFTGGYDELIKLTNLYYVEDEFNRVVKKQSYLRQEHNNFFIIQKIDINTYKYNLNRLSNLLGLSTRDLMEDDTLYNKTISILSDIQDEIMDMIRNNCKNYDDVEVPEDFSFGRKKNILSKEVLNQTIPITYYSPYNDMCRVKISTLTQSNFKIFYGTKEDSHKLKHAAKLFSELFNDDMIVNRTNDHTNNFQFRGYNNSNKGIIFCSVSTANLKYFKNIKNAFSINQFYNKMLYRKIDILTHAIQNKNNLDLFENIDYQYVKHAKLFSLVNDEFGKKLNNVIDANKKITSSIDKYKISQYVSLAKTFIDINNVQPNKSTIKHEALINEIINIINKNEKVMNYISLPYNSSDYENEIIDILKKVMVF